MQPCKETSAFQAVNIYIKILFYWPNLCLSDQENSLLIWHWGKSSQKQRIKSAVFQCCLPSQLISLLDQEQLPVSASLLSALSQLLPWQPLVLPPASPGLIWKGELGELAAHPFKGAVPPFLHLHTSCQGRSNRGCVWFSRPGWPGTHLQSPPK